MMNWNGVRVLITGGAGFIGSHLTETLRSAGATVRVLDNFSTGRRDNLQGIAGVDLFEADIRDAEACRRAAQDVEVLFHQAALGSVPRSMADPATTIAVNVTGTANVFAAAKSAGVRRVVYASSSSVYGDSEELPKIEGREGRVLSPYALSKRMNEELAELFAHRFAMELVGLRYFNVYGPRQDPEGPYAAVIPRFFRACLSGSSPVLFGDGEQSRDFTYVEDAVSANLLAATAPSDACGSAYNVGGGARTTVRELARQVAEVVGAPVTPRSEPPRPGDVRHSLADLRRATARLSYRPAVTLSAGLRRTAASFGVAAGVETT
jgi:nucleoside-diphosphate-sugar epimerase